MNKPQVIEALMLEHKRRCGRVFRPTSTLWRVGIVEDRVTRGEDGTAVSGGDYVERHVVSASANVSELLAEIAALYPDTEDVRYRVVSAQRLPEPVFVFPNP